MSEFVEFEVRLDPETHMQLAELAARSGFSLNELVNQALEQALYRRKGSRNQREGRYIGKALGRHVRMGKALDGSFDPRPDSLMAWSVLAAREAGHG